MLEVKLTGYSNFCHFSLARKNYMGFIWKDASVKMGTHHPLIRLKFQSMRWNPYLASLSGQESMSRQVMGPRGEPPTTTLLNEYSIKQTPNDIIIVLYQCMSPSFSEKLQFAVDGDQHRDAQLAQGQRTGDWELLSLTWDVFTTFPPPKTQGSLQRGQKDSKSQRWWMTTTKQIPQGSCEYELTAIVTACPPSFMWAQASPHLSMEWAGSESWSPRPSWGATVIDGCWERARRFSLRMFPLVRWSSSSRPHIQEQIVVVQVRLEGLERVGEMTQRWSDREAGWIWEELGKVNMIKTHLWNC